MPGLVMQATPRIFHDNQAWYSEQISGNLHSRKVFHVLSFKTVSDISQEGYVATGIAPRVIAILSLDYADTSEPTLNNVRGSLRSEHEVLHSLTES
ncbi:hypothetical protein BsWGS_14892 [Bradybaena similaris]